MKEESRRLLPPMSMLHSFSAAARLGSFSRAGREIGLTQGAVSRQIAGLEAWLGCRLFDRHGRRVQLNEAGRSYADAVEASLAGLRTATRQAIEQTSDRVVELAVLPSFGMRWLAPRLPALTALHPDLIVNFSARIDEFSFATEPFDAAIHFGQPNWPGAQHDLLFREQLVAVAAPQWAQRISAPADLLKAPLLVLSNRRDAWARWFAEQGISHGVPKPGASFEHFLMLAQAAAAGAGVALVPTFLVEPELDSGALVEVGPRGRSSEGSYYFVYPAEALHREPLRKLREWMISIAGAEVDMPGDNR